jgi:hypothetical protein
MGTFIQLKICLNMRSTLKQWQRISSEILEFQASYIPTIPPMQGIEAMVLPSFWDVGAWEYENAHGGCVERPPKL